MAHTIRAKTKLLNRVRRIRSGIDAVESAVKGQKSCVTVLQLIGSVREAITALMADVVEKHIVLHVAIRTRAKRRRRDDAAELLDVVSNCVK